MILLTDPRQILTGENPLFCQISTHQILTGQILMRQILTGQNLTVEKKPQPEASQR
ncbi:TPA: hypothetical protein JS220_004342 [Escherichia coli]|nr:hypothetical protein [Escherichia coli]EES5103378.1 hypothetical protein [Escherichia coli]EFF0687226.1 hypothetical protein [Escherichia coli]EFI1071008.1 hypothetical protein [Escherichia coli]EFK5195708.1 hypothetical protein [Escherichia coli]EHH5245321.1 hypothetical protein [Escherichia coli]